MTLHALAGLFVLNLLFLASGIGAPVVAPRLAIPGSSVARLAGLAYLFGVASPWARSGRCCSIASVPFSLGRWCSASRSPSSSARRWLLDGVDAVARAVARIDKRNRACS